VPQILAPPKEHNPGYHLRRSNGSAIKGMSSNSTTFPAELQGVTYVVRGEKSYELSNHLGNVLSVISDRREAGSCTDSLVDFYYADGKSVSDYYPFGMGMDGRTQSAGGYRWGFNGMEKYDDWQGEGNAYDFGARVYDSRLGRWMAVDPLAEQYPSFSPYISFLNNPLAFIDPDGRVVVWANAETEEFVRKAMELDPNYANVIRKLDQSDVVYNFNMLSEPLRDETDPGRKFGFVSANPEQNQINVNFSTQPSEDGWHGALYTLYHETEHAMQFEHGEIGFRKAGNGKWIAEAYDFMDEIKAHEFGLTSPGSEKGRYNWEGNYTRQNYRSYANKSKFYSDLLEMYEWTQGEEYNYPEHIEGNERTVKTDKVFHRTHVNRDE